MHIHFQDGSTATFELHHIYKGEDQKIINLLHKEIKLLTDALKCCYIVFSETTEDDERVTADKTIKGLRETVRKMKGELTLFKKRPIKTVCTFEYDSVKTTAHSSISKEDALLYKHSAKIGRQAAIRNLMRALGPSTFYHRSNAPIPAILPKDKRLEVVQALKSQM